MNDSGQRETEDDGYLEGFLETAFLTADPGDSTEGGTPLAAQPDPTELKPVHARYEVLGRIGRGAVGDVYRVRDRDFDRRLALKVLRPAHLGNAALTARFREESRLCSQLTHPGIVPVHEAGTLDDGRPYFTMKLVEGRSFAELLQTGSAQDERASRLQILRRVGETVAFAHAQGVVHGDLKPQNVMVGRFGEVQVMDWGFALRTGSERAAESRAGTPAYMAPEQAGPHGRMDARSDVYALGAMLFEVLAGRSPHAGARREAPGSAPDRSAEQRRHLEEHGVDARLAELTLRCLAFDPAARPSQAGEFAAELQDYLTGLEHHAREMELRAATAQASLEHARRARRFGLLAFVSILLGGAVIAWILAQGALERQRQLGELTRRVVDLENQARAERTLARAERDPSHWDLAVAAAERALALSRTPPGSEQLRAGAELLAAEMREGRDRARQLSALIEQLERIVPHLGDDRSAEELERQFAAAFATLGITDTEDAADERMRPVREHGGSTEILQALDSWILLRHRYGIPDAEAWRVPFAHAQALDADALHRSVREALVARQLDVLRGLAEEERLGEHDPSSLEFLGRCLFEAGARDRAESVFRRAHELYPGNARISHNLAILLDVREPEQRDEAYRLLSMALAARPHDAHLHTDIAVNRVEASAHELAEAWARRGIALEDDSPRAHYVLGLALQLQDRMRDAKAAYGTAHELGYHAAPFSLAALLLLENRYLAAGPLLDEALLRQPGLREARLSRALVRAELGETAAARQEFEALLERWPDWAEAWGRYALLQINDGQFDAAARAMQRCLELPATDREQQLIESWQPVFATRLALRDTLLPRLQAGEVPVGPDGLVDTLWLARRIGRPELGVLALERMQAIGPLPVLLAVEGLLTLAAAATRQEASEDQRERLRERLRTQLEEFLDQVGRRCAADPKTARQLRLPIERLHESPALRRCDADLRAQEPAAASLRAEIASVLAAIEPY